MGPQFARRLVQGYSADGKPIGAPGNQQGYYDFPGTGQMFSSARDLAKLLAASLGEGVIDPQLREAMQATQREAFRRQCAECADDGLGDQHFRRANNRRQAGRA